MMQTKNRGSSKGEKACALHRYVRLKSLDDEEEAAVSGKIRFCQRQQFSRHKLLEQV